MQQQRTITLVLFTLMLTVLAVAVPQSRAETEAFSLTVLKVGNGNVNVSPAPPYSNGQTVTLTAVPDAGWRLSGWTQGAANTWGDPQRDYRIPVTVAANGHKRVDAPAEVEVNFQTILTGLGGATFDPNSVRVVEVNASGAVIDDAVAFQFDVRRDFNPSFHQKNTGVPCYTQFNGQGTVVWIMKGTTQPAASRYYHIYFDQTGKGITPPVVAPQVKLTQNVVDAGQSSYKIETAVATYFFHRLGAGLSSLDDVNGNDWLSYSTTYGSAGSFRGIPNMVHPTNGGLFHPGNKDFASCILNEGPIKVTTFSNHFAVGERWTGTWEYYPNYADNTVHAARYDYYWLYEGTPGGKLDMDSDYFVFSDSTVVAANKTYEKDIPGDEWAYAVDPTLGRAFFMINHHSDSSIDSYRNLEGNMTVLAFGRNLASKAYLSKLNVPTVYTIGLMDTTEFTAATTHINGVFKPMTTTAAAGQKRADSSLGSDNPLQFTITGEHTITATFVPDEYTLTTTVEGSGTVTKSPNKPKYSYNEAVTLTATPAEGWIFARWEGDLTGSTNPAVVNMTGNKSIKAVFVNSGYVVTTSVVGQGTVAIQPNLPSYPAGTLVTLTATPAVGWSFSAWSGDLTGSTNPATKTVTGNHAITATFVPNAYTLQVNASGSGTVDWSPKKTTYAHGDVVTLTATPAAGQSFTGWSGALSGTTNPTTLVMTQNSVVTGNFTGGQSYGLTVNVDPAGKGTVSKSPDKPTYNQNEVVTLTATPLTNWVFKGWSGDLSGTANPAQVTMSAGKTITATFEQTAFVINVAAAGQGTVTKSPDKPTYAKGEQVTLTATPAAGWTFNRWNGAGIGAVENPLVITVNVDRDITAVFTQPSMMVSDSFDRCALGSGWTFINPLSDTSTAMLDGKRLSIFVPDTADHNVWSTGNNAPRIMQNANNIDFELRVKFSSPMNAVFQMQGVLVEQDADDYLRFEFQQTATGLTVYTARIVGGVASRIFQLPIESASTMEMAVVRAASRFTVNYRLGESTEWLRAGTFTQEMEVNQVGVFAGNVKSGAAARPSHTAVVEYFHNLADSETAPTDRSLLTLNINGQGQVGRSPAGPEYACGARVTLTPQPSAGWRFANWSGDLSGAQLPASITLNGPKTVNANFELDQTVETFSIYLPLGIR